jgi:hypothetical protein
VQRRTHSARAAFAYVNKTWSPGRKSRAAGLEIPGAHRRFTKFSTLQIHVSGESFARAAYCGSAISLDESKGEVCV